MTTETAGRKLPFSNTMEIVLIIDLYEEKEVVSLACFHGILKICTSIDNAVIS